MQKTSEITEQYVLGFVDGEGCFFIKPHLSRPSFSVTNNYRQVLVEIADKLGVPRHIYSNEKGRKNPTYQLTVYRYEDVRKLVTFFNEYLPIVKRNDYLEFRKAFENWNPRRWKKINDEQKMKIRELYMAKVKIREIALKVGVPLGSVAYVVDDIAHIRRPRKVF